MLHNHRLQQLAVHALRLRVLPLVGKAHDKIECGVETVGIFLRMFRFCAAASC